jgi:hypothetical protein
MNVRSISVRRADDWGHGPVNLTKPFIASIVVEGTTSKVELILSAEVSERVVRLIAEEVAEAGRVTAQAMVAEAFNQPALSASEGTF